MKVLVIEDEPAVARVIGEALRSQGNEVVIAGNGEEALQIVEGNPPDAIFLDIVMPGIDGIEVLRRVRQRDATLPVIILSGRASREQLEAARKLGVTDVLEKPLALTNLTLALTRTRSG